MQININMELKKLGFLLFLVSLFSPWTLPARCRAAAAGVTRRVTAENGKPNLVVGRGSFRTIREAIALAVQLRHDDERFVIKIKAGVYNENVAVDGVLPNLTLIGEGKGKTIITGELSYRGSNVTTYKTATVGVDGEGFIARGITFRNTAGPEAGQAVALRVSADRAAFYSCSFEGYQDTLYVHSGKQFYKKCDIYGTVDFIFGNAMAVFQNCKIYVRKPNNNVAVITASKRGSTDDKTGIIVQRSIIAPEPAANLEGIKVYLGRPWGDYARTVFMESNIGSLIDPEGWQWWEGKDEAFKDNIYYAEYKNYGAGASTAGRVNWAGVHILATPQEAEQFTVDKFIDGNSWLPATNVPFNSGL